VLTAQVTLWDFLQPKDLRAMTKKHTNCVEYRNSHTGFIIGDDLVTDLIQFKEI
jgi:hypothetical protein